MADQPAGEKVLPASPRKIQKARERGSVARSTDLSSGTMLLAGIFALWVFGPSLFRQMLSMGQYYFADSHLFEIHAGATQPVVIQALIFLGAIVLPVMGLLMIFGLTINITQFGINIAPQALQPKWERMNPIKGFQRIFLSIRSLVELVKSLAKLGIVGLVAYLTLRGRMDEVLSLMHLGAWSASIEAWELLFTVWWRIALAMIAIGLFDFAFQRWQYGRDLRMTRQEAQDELKELEGDPKIKQRIRAIQRQMAMQRMMGEVPEADVVVTNPTTYAVALRYDVGNMDAPTIVAKGTRIVADRIRELAVEHNVPIVERPELARAMYRTVEIGGYVPEDLFRAVAEVLAYVYEIDRRIEKIRERRIRREPAPVR